MNTDLAALVKRAKRFRVVEICAAVEACRRAPLSRRTIELILSGKGDNPRLDTIVSLSQAVTRLEAAAAKTKSIQKTAKKQTVARDSGDRNAVTK